MQQIDSEKTRNKLKESNDRIATIVKPGVLQYLPFKYAELGPDEVLVRMLGCGLDHNDIVYWEGRDWINYPLPSGVPGREGWGIVEKAGELTPNKPGEVVAVFNQNALSHYTICKHDQVHILPKDFKNINFPASAFAYAVNIFDSANIQKDDVVVLLGNGFSSSVISHLSKGVGAKTLKVAYTNKNVKKDIYGWDQIDELTNEVNRLTDSRGSNIVFECTGTNLSCDLATSLVREEGKLILARQIKDRPIKINLSEPCGLDIIIGHDQSVKELHEGTERTIELILEGKIKPDDFLSQVYTFDQLESAFIDLCKDAGEYHKLCIRF